MRIPNRLAGTPLFLDRALLSDMLQSVSLKASASLENVTGEVLGTYQ